MNKIFRVIWNHSTQSWVATSELTKSKGKTKSVSTAAAAVAAALVAMAGEASAAQQNYSDPVDVGAAIDSVLVNDIDFNPDGGPVGSDGKRQGIGVQNPRVKSNSITGSGNTYAKNSVALFKDITVVGNKNVFKSGNPHAAHYSNVTVHGSNNVMRGVDTWENVSFRGVKDSFVSGNNNNLSTGHNLTVVGRNNDLKNINNHIAVLGDSNTFREYNNDLFVTGVGNDVNVSNRHTDVVGSNNSIGGMFGFKYTHPAEAGRLGAVTNSTIVGRDHQIGRGLSQAIFGMNITTRSEGVATSGSVNVFGANISVPTALANSTIIGRNIDWTSHAKSAYGIADSANMSTLYNVRLSRDQHEGGASVNSVFIGTNVGISAWTSSGYTKAGNSDNVVVLGSDARAGGHQSIVIGKGAGTHTVNTLGAGVGTIAMGWNANTYDRSAIAIGNTSTAFQNNSVALGRLASVLSYKGYDARLNGESVAVGNGSTVLGEQSAAFGPGATVGDKDTLATATQAAIWGGDNGAGRAARVQAVEAKNKNLKDALAQGAKAAAQSGRDTALGAESETANYTIHQNADGGAQTAVGYKAVTSGSNATAVGNNTKAYANGTVAIGNNARAGKTKNQTGDGEFAIAVGDNAIADGNESVVMGKGAKAEGAEIAKKAVVLGSGAGASGVKKESVFLGSDTQGDGSHTIENVTEATVNGFSYAGFKGTVAHDGRFVNIGKKGEERKIINLAAGKIDATSTEAINGSQLYLVMDRVEKGWDISNSADGAAVDSVRPTDRVNFLGAGPVKVAAVKKAGVANGASDTVNMTFSVDTTNLANSDGKVSEPSDAAKGNLVNASTVRAAINNSGWLHALGKTGSGTNGADNNGEGTDADRLVNPGETVKFIAGDNIDISRVGNNFTISAKVPDAAGDTGGTTTGGSSYTFTAKADTGAEPVRKSKSLTIKGEQNWVKTTFDSNNQNPIITVNLLKASQPDNTQNAQGNQDGNIDSTAAAAINGVVTAEVLAKTINNAFWRATAATKTGSSGSSTNEGASLAGTGITAVKPGNLVTFEAGDGITINHDATDSKFTISAGTPKTWNLEENATKPGAIDVVTPVAATGLTKEEAGKRLMNASSIAQAINNSGFTLKTSATTQGEKDNTSTADEVINPGDNVEMIAGKNLKVKQADDGQITYSTLENVSFTSITVGAPDAANNNAPKNNAPKLSSNNNGDLVLNDANNPVTVRNVKKNLPDTFNTDALNKNNSPVTKKQELPNTGNNPGNVNVNDVVNNAATVGDILNAGFNLQNNAEAKDFVKPYDTLNFVDGTGTTATITTDAEGKVSKIQVDTIVQYTDPTGTPVKVVGGKGYPLNSVVGRNGKVYPPNTPIDPTTGNPTRADVPEAQSITDAPQINLVNNNNPTDKNPISLGNVKQAAGTLDGTKRVDNNNNLAPLEESPLKNNVSNAINGLADLKSAPDNNALTVTDARNLGWVVSASGNNYAGDVRNANEVRFIGEGLSVTGETNAATGVREIKFTANTTTLENNTNNGTVNIPGITETSTPEEKKAAGDKLVNATTVANAINEAGFVATIDTDTAAFEDQAGKKEQLVRTGEKLTFKSGKNIKIKQDGANFTVATVDVPEFKGVNLKNGDNNVNLNATKPNTLTLTGDNNAPVTVNNVKGNLDPTYNKGDLTDVDGKVVNNGVRNPKAAEPTKTQNITEDKVADVYNNVATVGDILNAGFNLQNNAEAKDFVKPYDTLNFVNGGNTQAVVETDADGKVSNISVNVVGLPVQFTDENGNPVAKVGDKFYKVDDKGKPDLTQPVAPNNLQTNMINPKATAPNTKGDATQLGNVNSGLKNYTDADKPNSGLSDSGKNKLPDLINLNTNIEGTNKPVPNENAATVGDLRNMGWVVSATGNSYSGAVKNANEVVFKGAENSGITVNGTVAGNVHTLEISYKPVTSELSNNPTNGTVNLTGDVNATPAQKEEAGKQLVNASTVQQAINDAGFVATIGTDAEAFEDQAGKKEQLVKTGDKLTLKSGKNIKVKQAVETKDGVTETSFVVATEVTPEFKGIDLEGKDPRPQNPAAPQDPAAPRAPDVPKAQINVVDGPVGVDGKGDDGKGSIAQPAEKKTRIEYQPKDPNGTPIGEPEKLATLNDGLKFQGNNNTVDPIAKKLNETLEIVGGVKDTTATPVSDKNTYVENKDGKLIVQFAEKPEFKDVNLKNGDNNVNLTSDANKPNTLTLNGDNNAPVTVSNVKKNLPDTFNTDALNKDSSPVTKKQELPNTGNNPGNINVNDVVNNAATVGDILNAGFNLQGNGEAKDFVKPYDTLNFVDGTGTRVTVSTDAEGKVSKIKVDTLVQYTDPAGNPVTVIDGKGYPLGSWKGKNDKIYGPDVEKDPITGNPVRTDASAVDPKTDAPQINLVNNNDANNNKPISLGNVKQATGTLDGTKRVNNDNTLSPLEASPLKNNVSNAINGLADLSSAPNNNALTVADAKNLGWVVSATGNNYAEDVRNAHEVRFKGDKGVNVTGETTAEGIRLITVSLDQGEVVKPNEFTANIGGNNVDLVKVGDDYYYKSDIDPMKGEPKPNTYPARIPQGTDVVNKGNNFVTGNKVAEAIQKSGWTLGKVNATVAAATTFKSDADQIQPEKVNPDDHVRFADSNSTVVSMATVETTDANGIKQTTTTVKVDVNTTYVAQEIAGDVKSENNKAADGSPTDANQLVATVNGQPVNVVKVGDKLYKAGDVDSTGKPKANVNTVSPDAGTSVVNSNPRFATTSDVVNAINNSGFTLKSSATADGKKLSGNDEVINPGDTVEMVAGKNMTVKQDADGKITYATKDDVQFTSVQFGDNNGPKITNKGGDIKVGDKDGKATHITNVAGNLPDTYNKDAVNKNNAPVTKNQELPSNAGDLVNNAASIGDVLNAGWNLKANGVAKDFVKPYDTVDFANGTGTVVNITADPTGKVNTIKVDAKVDNTGNGTNITVGPNGIKVDVKLGDNLSTNPRTGNVEIATTNLTNAPEGKINTPVAAEGGKLVNATTVANAINNSGFTLKTSGNTATPNVKEVINPGKTVDMAAGKNMTVAQSANGVVTYATANDVDFNSVKVGDVEINQNGINAGNKVISNVAPGEKPTDAVNVSQLKGTVNNVANHLGNKINRQGKDLRAGIAGSNAAAGLPQVYIPGKSMVAASAGTFKGQSAVAVGYSRASDNGKLILKLQGNANTRGDVGGSVGVGYQW